MDILYYIYSHLADEKSSTLLYDYSSGPTFGARTCLMATMFAISGISVAPLRELVNEEDE